MTLTEDQTQQRDDQIELSLVIPLYNEVDSVQPLYRRICDALEQEFECYEVVFVDDGSTDETLTRLLSIVEVDERVRVVQLSKNFGQTAAMQAGIDFARGRVIVTLDGDLQNDPHDIPALVEKLYAGHDVVIGWRRHRRDPFLSRKLPSKVANWIIAKSLGVPIHDTGCSLKAFRRELIQRLPLYSDFHRFLPALSTLASSRLAEVEVTHHPRTLGKSKYGLSRVGRVVLDVTAIKMLLSCSRRPLHWFGCWSIPFFLAAAAAGIGWLTFVFSTDVPVSFMLPAVSLLLAYLGVHLLLAGTFGDLVVCADPTPRVEPLADCMEVRV